VRAPSTIGSWLWAFKWSNVRQLDAVGRELLARTWAAGGGPADLAAPLTIDVDFTICEVYGRASRAPGSARRRHRAADGARGLGVLLPGRAADRAQVRRAVLRHGQAQPCDPGRDRGDRRGRVDADPVLAQQPDVSGADVAETSYTCFAGTKQALTVRLVVRRVRPTPESQLALFAALGLPRLRHRLNLPLVEVEADQRPHAVVEQTIAELKSAGLAHLPSGRFMANAAWLALTALAHNLGRALGILTGGRLARATAATLHRTLFTMPARLVHSARRQRLRAPERWPWRAEFETALAAIAALPRPA
jgi:hypothetical protein